MLFFFSSFVAFSVINNMFHIINIIKIQNNEFKFDKLVKYYRVNYYLDPWFSERISARLEYATRSSTRRKITTRFTRWHISPRRAKANRSSSLPRKFHFQICNRVSSSLRHPSYLLQFHSTVLKPTTKRYKKLQVESRQNSRRPKILPSKISLLQDTYIYIYTYVHPCWRESVPRDSYSTARFPLSDGGETPPHDGCKKKTVRALISLLVSYREGGVRFFLKLLLLETKQRHGDIKAPR